MLAAGENVEPFWEIYQQHYHAKSTFNILKPLRVGTLHKDDILKPNEVTDQNDPYKDDPKVSPIFTFHQKKPINAEPNSAVITDNWITPINLWFVRNHHPVPHINANDYKLKININQLNNTNNNINNNNLNELLELNLNSIKTNYKKHTIVSTIQCGGNRRSEMNKFGVTAGSPWKIGAISTGKFAGAKLRDILHSINITEDTINDLNIKHIQFIAHDGLEASIPIRKALNQYGDVILAYEMNDVDIPAQEGYPIRLIVPGYVGVRNVKWVTQIILSSEESYGPWQRGMAYKGFSPSTKNLNGIDVEKVSKIIIIGLYS